MVVYFSALEKVLSLKRKKYQAHTEMKNLSKVKLELLIMSFYEMIQFHQHIINSFEINLTFSSFIVYYFYSVTSIFI